MKQLVVVVIIAHKSELTENEKASLRQCYKILGGHPIKLICPKGLNIAVYKEINPDADIVFIDPKWQATYKMFNELKKDKLLYEMFSDYQYMLYYELDAWVFRDELEYWCAKDFDYIGAPMFFDPKDGIHYEFRPGQNGGFSLRKISTSLVTLKTIRKMLGWRKLWYRSKFQSIIPFENIVFEKVFKIKFTQYFKGLLGAIHYNEDGFWSRYVPATFPDFRIASRDESIRFSFERNPSFLFKLNSGAMPFGCHKWLRYEPEFWKKYITL